MTTTLDEIAENESWGIRGFQLVYGVPKDCSFSVIDSISMPAFIGTNYFNQHNIHLIKVCKVKQKYLNWESLYNLTLIKQYLLILQLKN